MALLIQSFFVYGLMIFVMMHAGKFAYDHQYPDGFSGNDIYAKEKTSYLDILVKSHFIIPILVFCLFVTIRFEVGSDCATYKNDFYEVLLKGNITRESYEYGYIWLLRFTSTFTNKHYLIFAIFSFIQISMLYYAIRKESYLQIFLGLTLFTSLTFHSMVNGVRQNTAACIFVAMIPLILKKEYWVWIIPCTIAASLLHKTAILILLLSVAGYFCKNKLLNNKVQLTILAICYLLMDKFEISALTPLFNVIGGYAGYDETAIENYSDYTMEIKNFGFLSHLHLLVYIIIVLYSNKMEEFFKSKKFNIYYNLFFIGVCIFLLFYNNFTINRLLYYCVIFIPIIEAYLFSYLFINKNKNNNTALAISISLQVIAFLYHIYTGYINFPNETVLYKFDI